MRTTLKTWVLTLCLVFVFASPCSWFTTNMPAEFARSAKFSG